MSQLHKISVYKLSTNLNMEGFPHASVEQFFTELEDLIIEIKDSLIKCPDMTLTIETKTTEI